MFALCCGFYTWFGSSGIQSMMIFKNGKLPLISQRKNTGLVSKHTVSDVDRSSTRNGRGMLSCIRSVRSGLKADGICFG